jgi:hypothetical protein
MNKIRTKKTAAYILVDAEGNFSEITYTACSSLWNNNALSREYILIARDAGLVITDDKTGDIIYTSEWGDCTIAQGIDGYFADLFSSDALYELQRQIQKGKLAEINFILTK